MLRKLWEKCVNYETVSYIICGFLTTAVDFAVYALLRQIEIGVGPVSYTHLDVYKRQVQASPTASSATFGSLSINSFSSMIPPS